MAPIEMKLYEQVKENLRARALRSGSVQTLAMIGRLRQLGSSIPAAIKGWRENNTLSELLWEDLGLEYDDDEGADYVSIVDVDLSVLEDKDTKYRALVDFIKGRLTQTASEKIILFSFYRGTIGYLARRLRADGITCAVILGGMGDEKHREIARFADPRGPSILISSEVGSEGIDLQFAKVLINYDLPWNPMKVEQRIGRIDRLGQKSDKIHIINFVARDTIEEIVFDRLYTRLRIFEESIGDLEEVLGQSSDELLMEYFRDGLTDAQLAKRLEQNALTAERHRVDAEELEKDAPELIGHTDFILSHIQKGRDLGRWIRPQDLLGFVTDVLADLYPGSRIERHKARSGVFEVNLNTDARAALQVHIETYRPARSTRCHVPGEVATVAFSIADQTGNPRPEVIDLSHPLVLWLRAELDRRGQQAPAVAIELSADRSSIPSGSYTFAVDLWRMDGLQKQIVMRTRIVGTDGSSYDGESAEQLVDEAARLGRKLDIYQLQKERSLFVDAFSNCEADLQGLFAKEAHLFQLDNEQRVRQATIIAEERAAKKLAMLRERLAGQRASEDERRRRAIPLTEGQIRRLVADRDQRLSRIRSMEHANMTTRSVSGGIILVK